MERHGHALVLGAGIMGLSAAWALHRRGWKVRVLDQATPPNPVGASVDHHRLIRHAYGAQHGYMRMVDDAYAAWARIWADLGEVLYEETGVLALDEGTGAWLPASRAAMRDHGLAMEDLTAATVAARFPIFSGDGVADAFFTPRGGVLLAEPIVAGLAGWLARQGVEFLRGTARDVAERRLTLTDGTVLTADAVVVAAGPWAPRLLPGLKGRVTASRQIIVRLAAPPDLATAWSRAPMLLDLAEEGGFYMVPPVRGTPIKVGDHSFSLAGDAEDDRDATPAEAETILALARRRIPGLDRFTPLGARACYYDVEPAEEFLAETLAPGTLLLSGFSGHGFKFGPLLGEAVANALGDPALLPYLAGWAAGRENPAPGLLRTA
ncbi:FAD-dependent oxidoreductase [Rhodovarius lipocyclicus]|uniref:FAD-dependent oxidoreductase n=1 Tax=Rhodovarius lipocyclicus TaxID=268410 RepID=UPI001358F675|nr:FAD-dependent oxidoreductase [Rhodovarius lipocyclicus]